MTRYNPQDKCSICYQDDCQCDPDYLTWLEEVNGLLFNAVELLRRELPSDYMWADAYERGLMPAAAINLMVGPLNDPERLLEAIYIAGAGLGEYQRQHKLSNQEITDIAEEILRKELERDENSSGNRKNPDSPFSMPDLEAIEYFEGRAGLPIPTGWKSCPSCSVWVPKFEIHVEKWKDEPELGLVCAEHSSSPKIQYTTWPLTKFIGNFVKLAFPIPPIIIAMARHRFGILIDKEHLWVGITGLAEYPDQDLHGLIYSLPRFAYPWMPKSELEFKLDEIEDFLEGPV